MKIRVQQVCDTYNMDNVVAVITHEQWLKLLEVVRDKSVLLEILGNDKMFTEEK